MNNSKKIEPIMIRSFVKKETETSENAAKKGTLKFLYNGLNQLDGKIEIEDEIDNLP